MSNIVFTYRRGAEEPRLTLPWREQVGIETWADLDLSAGYTFVLELWKDGVKVVDKNSNITGFDGYVEVVWATGELDIAPGTYILHLRATGGTGDRDYAPGKPVLIVIIP